MSFPSKGQSLLSKEQSVDFAISFKKGTKTKLTIIITKKTAPKAVSRNRTRRLIREIIRGVNFKGDLKVVVKQDLSGLKLADVAKKLEPRMKKLNIK